MNTVVEQIYVINMKKDINRLINFKKSIGSLFNYKVVKGVDPINDTKYKEKYKIWNLQNKIDTNFENFEWKYYIKRYQDLQDAKINSKEKAWNHWINCGEKELRSCNPLNDIVNKRQWGCLYSHINILKNAIKHNYKSILVLEDDIILTSNIQEKINNLRDFVKKQEKWNIIYLGASQHEWSNIQLHTNYYNANNSTGTFAYMVHNHFYKILLDKLLNMKKPVDNYLVDIQNKYYGSIYVIYPNIIICDLEESNIGEKRNNYKFGKKFRWII